MAGSLLLFVLVAAMASQTVVMPVLCRKIHLSTHVDAASVAGAKQVNSSLCSSPSPSPKGYGSSTPTPSHHGGIPTAPSTGGGYYSPPRGAGSTPSSPVSGSPSTPSYKPVPTTPSTPSYSPTPTTPSSPSYTPTPTTPTFPYRPWGPGNSTFPPNFTGTCDYWRSHPQAIWDLFGGYWCTLGSLLGSMATPTASQLGVMDALTNTRTDGFGALYREGTAAFLNSMVNQRFPFTTTQVRNAFAAALVSDKAAADQAQIFRSANEGHLKR